VLLVAADITPKTPSARTFCVFYVIVGLVVVGYCISSIISEVRVWQRRLAVLARASLTPALGR
jgi:hypothetical protein